MTLELDTDNITSFTLDLIFGTSRARVRADWVRKSECLLTQAYEVSIICSPNLSFSQK